MVRTCVDSTLLDLKWLEDDARLTAAMKDQIQVLKMELRFIQNFLIYMESWSDASTDSRFQSLRRNIEAALSSAAQGLYGAGLLAMYKRKKKDWELLVSNLLEKINDLKKEIRVACDVWSKCTLQIKSPVSAEIALEFLDPLLENLSALVALKADMMFSVKKQIEVLKGKLQFLRNFVSFMSNQCNEHEKWETLLTHGGAVSADAACLTHMSWVDGIDEKMEGEINFVISMSNQCNEHEKWKKLLTHVGAVSADAACLTYMCWVDEIDEKMECGINILLSDLRQFVEPNTSEIIEMYLELLKASKPSEASIAFKCKVIASFVDFLLDNLVVHVKDKFEILHEQVVFLIIYLTNPLGEETQYREKMLLLTEEVVNEYQSLIIYSYKIDLTTKEIQTEVSLLLSKLQEKANFIMVEIFLMELLKQNSTWMVSVKDHVNALHEGLKFCIDFLMAPPKKSTEDVELMFLRMEEMAKEARALVDSIDGNKMTEDLVMEMNLELAKLFDNIKLIKQVELLIKLFNCKASKFVHSVDLEMDLSFLKAFLLELPKEYKTEEKLIFTQIEAVVSDAVSILDPVSNKAVAKNTVTEVDLPLFDLLHKIKYVKAEVSTAYLQVPRSSILNFPRTDGAGFIEFFIGNLRVLLNDKVDLISQIKNHLEIILRALEFFRPILGHNDQDELRDTLRDVIDVAYQAEYAIDLYLVKGEAAWYCILWLSHIIEDIMIIKKDAPTFSENTSITRVVNVQNTSNRKFSSEYGIAANEVVGLKNKAEDIMTLLLGGNSELEIIPIVGEPGLGKTTLARSVYEDPLTISKFHIRAWCYISQVYEKRDLIVDILAQVSKSADRIDDKMTAEDLAQQLCKSLRGRKYLIVLDDIWDVEVWHELRLSFPDDHNASRIMFTSRLHNLASQAGIECDIYSLCPFTEEECSELLQKMLFCEKVWPKELSAVGTQISKLCDGLPLVVVVIAGVLAQIMESTEDKGKEIEDKWQEIEDKWKGIEEGLKSTVPGDSKHFMEKLDMSYRHLPDHLKACFLYLGAFAFEREIPVRKLIRLWIAEGLVQEPKAGSLEDAAESYLMDLIDRSLITIAKRRSNGRVKACNIHNLLRDLCLKWAVEENFLQTVGRKYKISGSDMGVSPTLGNYDHYRLSIYSKREDLVSSIKPFGVCVRSLLFFSSNDVSIFFRLYDISFISNHLKVLRVLDLGSIKIGDSFPSGLEKLIHLRYLSIRGEFNFLPSSIAHLWNLETLLVKGLRGEIDLPDTFWNMARLRHVQITGRVHIMVNFMHDYEADYFSNLDKLENLTTPSFYYSRWRYVRSTLRRLPNLRKLRCVLLESWNNGFPDLYLLSKLESLKVLNHGYLLYPCHFSLPDSLKKLTLSKFQLPWDAISTIGRLPNLEVLKLLNKAFLGHQWDMKAGEFKKLKYLKFSYLEIVEWNASPEDFPPLQQVVLQRCEYLEEIPSCLSEISTLKLLQVQWCSSKAANAAREIQEEQLENGNKALEVLIHPQYLDVDSSSL